ncbi:MAG: hypothetical protein ACF8PN_15895 [Phycisphaerales bacterium]
MLMTLLAMAMAAPSLAQDADRDEQAQYLEDFIHYVFIARPDLAAAQAEQLFQSGVADADLYTLVDEFDLNRAGRLDEALDRATRIPELEPVAGEIRRRLRDGRVALARDPNEIDRHIQNLVGSQRARLIAREALVSAGEYAVPQLLERLENRGSLELKDAVRRVLVEIGRQAVTPLSVALPYLTPETQELVVDILGQIGYAHARPALAELIMADATEPRVRDAAERAYQKLGGASNASIVDQWLGLAEQYWVEARSLIAWPDEDINNIWNYESRQGLVAVSVPSSIFSEIMAMRMSENALSHNENSKAALSLWIAANFRRSDQLPSEATDPTYPDDMRAPIFFAVAAGPEIGQRVLARANRDLNAQLARHAIEALERTAGGATLWTAEDRPTPLIEALNFPERRVRYDAALALANALPTESFYGADRVIPILASAIRTGGESFAAVIASDEEDRRTLAASLRSMGFSVLPPRSNFEDLRVDLTDSPGVDLFVILDDAMRTVEPVTAIRRDPRLSASPVLVMTSGAGVNQARDLYIDDRRVRVVSRTITEDQLGNAVDAMVSDTLGPLMSADEADAYALESLRALRDVAIKNTPSFEVIDAEAALLEALQNFDGEKRLIAAETLSWIDNPDSQQALLDASLTEGDELTQATLLGFAADSAKRFGAYASDRQVNRLLELVRTGSGVVATAAGQAHGALDLPASNVTTFILDRR